MISRTIRFAEKNLTFQFQGHVKPTDLEVEIFLEAWFKDKKNQRKHDVTITVPPNLMMVR
jgi:hypothetical protein